MKRNIKFWTWNKEKDWVDKTIKYLAVGAYIYVFLVLLLSAKYPSF